MSCRASVNLAKSYFCYIITSLYLGPIKGLKSPSARPHLKLAPKIIAIYILVVALLHKNVQIVKNFFQLRLHLLAIWNICQHFWCLSFYVNVKYVPADLVERLVVVVCTSNPTSKESQCIKSFFWSLYSEKNTLASLDRPSSIILC